ncbi:hypothetical protein J437_LFUL012433 [Ladona fulva]|uniref:DNA 3'-5' helicase n=1 Tax=Ladona fulva TaxID=123851 RepID=A0A8K0KF62_LADFU|nr:hypothetical protein J437_LFUL012433 [Ladona fulva]
MASVDDVTFKLQYKKYKIKVKLWEANFVKRNGRLPSKDDIKAASPDTKEAYKKYWKLKTLNLQRTILDSALLCEDESMSCFDDTSRDCVIPVSQESSSEESKLERKVLADIQNDSISPENKIICANSLNSADGDCSSTNDTNKKSEDVGVWGAHLNNPKPVSREVISLKSRSSSFQFTKKLFEASKFNSKRNPRKSFRFSDRSRSDTSLAIEESSTNSCDVSNYMLEQPINNEVINPNVIPPGEEAVSFFPDLLEKNDKFKIIKSTEPKIQNLLSALHKRVLEPETVLTPTRKLDKGWVERNSFLGVINDSKATVDEPKKIENVDVSQQSVSQQTQPSENNKTSLSSNDNDAEIEEDVISDSDTESSQKTSIFQSCIKRKKISGLTSNEHFDDRPKKIPKRDETPLSSTESSRMEETQNIIVSLPKAVVEKLNEATEVSFNTSKSVNNSEKNKKQSKSKPSKLEILQRKLASGKANENFVKIDIKKKVYVRGKKNTSFSKYKKMMYKKKAKDGDELCGRPVVKCFKCGEIGHYSRNCLKVDKLLPQDDGIEEESSFPTLEEASQMAKQSNYYKSSAERKDDKADLENAVEEFTIQMDVVGSETEVKPLYQLKDDNSLIEFRQGQEEAIMRILSGQSTLLMLSTGAGKSLCYQLPAYLYSQSTNCITLVVSPLVSLMEDQVEGLPSFLKAACLHTNQTEKQRAKVFELVKKGKLHFLLVSPEAVVGCSGGKGSATSFGSLLSHLPPIAFACIDEAHCVSQWSHNFRPSYLMVCKTLRDKLGVKTVLGLTATATSMTASNIASNLKIPDGEKGIIKGIPLPNNLVLSVSEDEWKDDALITLMKGKRFKDCGSLIIYCTRREECERIATLIRTTLQDPSQPESNKRRNRISWNAEAYHAGLSAARRKKVQHSFMNGDLRIVVATVAFGMGINKHDIRGVIHYNMPKNFESYVQEVGRAGRDGLPAQCHVFLDSKKVFLPCSCVKTAKANSSEESSAVNMTAIDAVHSRSVCPGHEVAIPVDGTVNSLDLPDENIATLLCYLELHPKRWIEVSSRVYTMCKVQCYQGAKQLKEAAHKCPPLAMAIASDLEQGVVYQKCSSIEFPVVKVASSMGWDSGVVKRHLKNLEWKKSSNDKWQRTGILVEFSEVGYHFKSPGNLSPSELDEALDSLHSRVVTQEEASLSQLEAIFSALRDVSHKSCLECADEADVARSDKLKGFVNEYFAKGVKVEPRSPVPLENEEQVRADIKSLICSYREQTFTGRSVARILHGIASPCFPAHIWGKTRFWRLHLLSDFKSLSKVATEEILKLR